MMTDVFAKCGESAAWARALSADGPLPYGRPITERHGTEAVLDGRRVLMAGSSDYLGLSTHPKVVAAAADAARRYGTSCSGAPVMNGTLGLHVELERRLAGFLGREAALVTTTGFTANLALAALLDRDDEVYADASNHASLVDATRLGRARHQRYEHGDLGRLARLLESGEADAGRLIVTDGLFSMEGDVCDLPGLVKLAREHGARLVVDCAHDLGLLGEHGRGAPELHDLESAVDLVTGTFSKSLGSVGGVVAGTAEVVHFLRHRARSVLFSAALPPPSAAAALAALDIVEAEPERRRKAHALAGRLREGLRGLGLRCGGESAIVPVFVGDDRLCRRLWAELLAEGVYVNAVSAPGVPEGRELIRIGVTAAHTEGEVERIVEAFGVAGRRVGSLS